MLFPPLCTLTKKKKKQFRRTRRPRSKVTRAIVTIEMETTCLPTILTPNPPCSLWKHTHTQHTLYLSSILIYLYDICHFPVHHFSPNYIVLTLLPIAPHPAFFQWIQKNSHFPFDNSNCFLLASYITIGCFRFSNYYYFIDSTLALFSGDLKKRRRRKSTLALKKSSQQLVQSFHSEFTELVRPTVYVRKVNIQTITHSALLRVFHLLFTTVGSMTRINSSINILK